jgi:hypothetical protein
LVGKFNLRKAARRVAFFFASYFFCFVQVSKQKVVLKIYRRNYEKIVCKFSIIGFRFGFFFAVVGLQQNAGIAVEF